MKQHIGPEIKLGSASIRSIQERVETGFKIEELFKEFDQREVNRNLSWLVPVHYDTVTQILPMSFHSWLVKSRYSNILIDTCIGNHKIRPTHRYWTNLNIPYMERLKAVGVEPEDINYVMCTHLHCDHVGWNTRLVDGRWVPTFGNAKYIFGRMELESCEESFKADDPKWRPDHRAAYQDSVLPILESGQALIIDDDFVLEDLLRIEPTPGHTAGHVSFWIESGSCRGVFAGDAFHHPLEVFNPHWTWRSDPFPEKSYASRLSLLNQCVDTDTIMFTGHFMDTHAGRVLSSSDGFRFEFLRYA